MSLDTGEIIRIHGSVHLITDIDELTTALETINMPQCCCSDGNGSFTPCEEDNDSDENPDIDRFAEKNDVETPDISNEGHSMDNDVGQDET